MSIATQLQRFNQAKEKREREEQLALETQTVAKQEAKASTPDAAMPSSAASIAAHEQSRASADYDAARKEKDDEKARLRDLEIHNRQQANASERNQIKEAMREEDTRALAERRAISRDQQAPTQSGRATTDAAGPTLERGNAGRPEFVVDTLALDRGGAASLGHGQVSRAVALDNYTRERSLAGAGTEHTSPSKHENYVAAAQDTVTTIPPETTYEPRFGAEALPGTEASRDRDELDSEGGKGYHEQFDAVNDERSVDRSGDDYSDRVPTHPEQHTAAAPSPAGQGSFSTPTHAATASTPPPASSYAPAPQAAAEQTPQAVAARSTDAPTPTPAAKSHNPHTPAAHQAAPQATSQAAAQQEPQAVAARSTVAPTPAPAAKSHNPYTPAAHQAAPPATSQAAAQQGRPTPQPEAARAAPAPVNAAPTGRPAPEAPAPARQPEPQASTATEQPPHSAPEAATAEPSRPSFAATLASMPNVGQDADFARAPETEASKSMPEAAPAVAAESNQAEKPAREPAPEPAPEIAPAAQQKDEVAPAFDQAADQQIPDISENADAPEFGDSADATNEDIDVDHDADGKTTEPEAGPEAAAAQKKPQTAATHEVSAPEAKTPAPAVEHQAEAGRVTIKEDLENENEDDYGL